MGWFTGARVPTCPRHNLELELTAAPVGRGFVLACPVRSCSTARLPDQVRDKVIPGLGRMPRQEETEDFDLVLDQATGSSKLEAKLLAQLRQRGIPEPLTEFEFHPVRRWRFDLAWPALKVAVEVQGGIWTQGRHTRGKGFAEECQKRRAAAIAGWCVLEYVGDEIHSKEAVREIGDVVKWKMRDD